MKDVSKKVLETHMGNLSDKAPEWVGFCLGRLYADRKHTLGMEVVHGLTFEELIGAFQAARQYFQLVEFLENDSEALEEVDSIMEKIVRGES